MWRSSRRTKLSLPGIRVQQRWWKASGCENVFIVLEKFKFPLVADEKSEDRIVNEVMLQNSGISNLTFEALERLARHLIYEYWNNVHTLSAGGSFLFLSLLIFFKQNKLQTTNSSSASPDLLPSSLHWGMDSVCLWEVSIRKRENANNTSMF